jgi:hypothetical protein
VEAQNEAILPPAALTHRHIGKGCVVTLSPLYATCISSEEVREIRENVWAVVECEGGVDACKQALELLTEILTPVLAPKVRYGARTDLELTR